MIIDQRQIRQVYLVCGKTDLRRGIDGLAGVVQDQFELDPYNQAPYLFCGTRKDRFKALYWDGDDFLLLYKRIENGRLQWPTIQNALRKQVAELTEMVAYLTKKLYGQKSEQTDP
ncbi:IS66 family insertion sequence element accessory protein TnpB (plasmid) [Companilactobacillus crustorum]|uniref:IS66 family insertion sequence element accessory protein TnpB n=1 Tax=Companilactobacillus crustorum TaxID=392416 RepID=UPI00237E210C|nr:IS66 family insertion sequence element accessory protein TnpB [Companilactobacillus crustorum]WDT66866.1 IS66 family insertion sequence element accessory protein TnpB [Companilactobacillus crustorum]